jgi:hypothetical protein
MRSHCTKIKRPATLPLVCAVVLCVAFSTALAATVEWHLLGDPGTPPPTSFVTTPAILTPADTISFVSPVDGKIYQNAEAAADICGNPLISVDVTNQIVAVNFTPPLDEPIPGPFLVSGIDGQFGPIGAGTWQFLVFSNSGALIFSTNFSVANPSLGIVLAGKQVVLSWAVWASNYVLQTAADLSSGSWRNVTNGISTNGASCIFTNTVGGQAAYFRLQEQ